MFIISMIVASDLWIKNIQISSDVVELHNFVDLAPGIDPPMRLTDDQPIPIAGVAFQEIEV